MKRIYLAMSLTVGFCMTPVTETRASDIGQSQDALTANTPANDSIICRINGTVIDRPEATSALIIEAEKDFRIHQGYTVPITDGKFSLTIHDAHPLAYEVIFDDELKRGSWKTRNFFSGNDEVNLTYHDKESEDEDKVVSNISDNVLAAEFSKMEEVKFKQDEDRIFSLIDSLHDKYTPQYQNLLDTFNDYKGTQQDSIRDMIHAYNKGPAEKRYSQKYLEYHKELNGLFSQSDSLKRKFISENPSVYGLFQIKYAFALLRSRLEWIDIDSYIDIFENIYKERMNGHPYVNEIQGLIDAMQVKAGNRYPDYRITREDGSTEQIESLIKGNVAVIDLWASWCGPCRKHSKELIPLYEKYKDKGFKVVAVARESEDCYAMNYAMKQDGYPWETFVDLNDRDKVWLKNQAGNGGGKIILVNSDGTIVGTDIPTEEIKSFLINAYGE